MNRRGQWPGGARRGRYTDHELDAEFIHLLREACKGYVQRNPDASLDDIAAFLNARVSCLLLSCLLSSPTLPYMLLTCIACCQPHD